MDYSNPEILATSKRLYPLMHSIHEFPPFGSIPEINGKKSVGLLDLEKGKRYIAYIIRNGTLDSDNGKEFEFESVVEHCPYDTTSIWNRYVHVNASDNKTSFNAASHVFVEV